MKIRKLMARDAEEAMALLRRVVKDMRAHGYMQWDDVYPNIDVVRQDIADGTLYGAWREDRLLGVVTLNTEQSPEYGPIPFTFGEPAMVVHRLAVDPGSQRQGISAQLMDFVELLAAQSGAVTMRLDTCEDNLAAQRLYLGRGYVQRGTCHFPRRTFTFLVMEKKLV